jgi:hypothetical protein
MSRIKDHDAIEIAGLKFRRELAPPNGEYSLVVVIRLRGKGWVKVATIYPSVMAQEVSVGEILKAELDSVENAYTHRGGG